VSLQAPYKFILALKVRRDNEQKVLYLDRNLVMPEMR